MNVEMTCAVDLHHLEQNEEVLKTGLPPLDKLFGGGVHPGTFMEIVGLSSTGKSQLWLVEMWESC